MFEGEKNCRHASLSAGDQSKATELLRGLIVTTSSTKRRISCVFKESGSLNQSSGKSLVELVSLLFSRIKGDGISMLKAGIDIILSCNSDKICWSNLAATCSLCSWVPQSKLDTRPVLLVNLSRKCSDFRGLSLETGISKVAGPSEDNAEKSGQVGLVHCIEAGSKKVLVGLVPKFCKSSIAKPHGIIVLDVDVDGGGGRSVSWVFRSWSFGVSFIELCWLSRDDDPVSVEYQH